MTALSASTFIYERMLNWYPPELRAEYGAEMVEVFAEHIEMAWQTAAWRGLARAWAAVFREVACIVVPYQGARALPVVLAMIFSAAVYGAVLVAVAPNPHCIK